MSLAEGKMPTESSAAPPSGVTLPLPRSDHSGTSDDVSISVPVWARYGCPGVRFLREH
jgi:hypothetical protein